MIGSIFSLTDGSTIVVTAVAIVTTNERALVLIHQRCDGAKVFASKPFIEHTEADFLVDAYCAEQGLERTGAD